MRLLADENFPKSIVEALGADGHDVYWARTHCTGWKDAKILEFAEAESRILLTLDKDFWQIAVQRRVSLEQSGVVWFRVHPATPDNISLWCVRLSRRIGRGPDISVLLPLKEFRYWLSEGADGSLSGCCAALPRLAEEAAAQWTGRFSSRPFDARAAFDIYQAAYWSPSS